MVFYVLYISVKFHQNIQYNNRATSRNACFIYGRRDSSRWLLPRLPVVHTLYTR